MENGKPMVPYFKVQWELPPGTVVQEVKLRERGDLKTAIGLVLPLATMATDAEGAASQAQVAESRGWYPAKEFDWRLIPGPGGSSTLIVLLYPFHYNSQTTEVRFYSAFRD